MLDPRLLRAFVGVIDDASFTRAAERLHMTQSTISQQIGRLEEQLGHALIDREQRPVGLTPAGERLIGYARRILSLQDEADRALRDPAGTQSLRIGLAEDIFTLPTARIFADFTAQNRRIRLDVTAGLSRDLSARYRQGEFDLIVVKEPEAGPDCRASFPEPIGWFESLNAPDWADPLPLVTFPPGGLYRDDMFRRAEAENLRWYVAFAGNSLPSVLTAIEAGLGVSLLPQAAVVGRAVRRYQPFGVEPAMRVSLYAWEAGGPAAPLIAAMREALAQRQAARP
ncbi:LysR family transcriptional regulator [Paracoccus laeviglucosivorans]|uniref:DNA-binding transcriptional regulator, LysR family n=1 Tax=Paracoccus laeviglucosivorans TaxID=1197861 RepID=A0A521CB04_9RHOB|nr:LysR family transcriptional regulator [Paracoccus laeviglucosivorans]SMO56574.1 DNA-binding transcriptional regulator, LysR family [Paracoccus laeviglucosivorans]